MPQSCAAYENGQSALLGSERAGERSGVATRSCSNGTKGTSDRSDDRGSDHAVLPDPDGHAVCMREAEITALVGVGHALMATVDQLTDISGSLDDLAVSQRIWVTEEGPLLRKRAPGCESSGASD